VAHNFFAQVEADNGQAKQAIVRLLGVAKRHGNDAELFAGLVHACRYCGLFEQAIAAHEEARRLDPHVPTSILQTLLMAGDTARLLGSPRSAAGGSGDAGIRVIGLGLAGRRAEAKEALLDLRPASRIPAFSVWIEYLLAWLEERPADMLARIAGVSALKIQDDPEAVFQEGWLLCDVGEHDQGLEYLRRAVAKGYYVSPTLAGFRHFDALRSDPAFQRLQADAEAGRQDCLLAFRDAGGEQLLGH
jgi:hypothetical protein